MKYHPIKYILFDLHSSDMPSDYLTLEKQEFPAFSLCWIWMKPLAYITRCVSPILPFFSSHTYINAGEVRTVTNIDRTIYNLIMGSKYYNVAIRLIHLFINFLHSSNIYCELWHRIVDAGNSEHKKITHTHKTCPQRAYILVPQKVSAARI